MNGTMSSQFSAAWGEMGVGFSTDPKGGPPTGVFATASLFEVGASWEAVNTRTISLVSLADAAKSFFNDLISGGGNKASIFEPFHFGVASPINWNSLSLDGAGTQIWDPSNATWGGTQWNWGSDWGTGVNWGDWWSGLGGF